MLPNESYTNFKLLKTGLNVLPALDEVYRLNCWNWVNLRRIMPGSCHLEVDDIVLRFAPLDRPQTFQSFMDGLETVSYWTMFAHTAVVNLVNKAFSDFPPSKLGRIVVSKIPPRGKVYPHPDEGGYARMHDRYHIVLSSEPGNTFKCDGEEVWMRPGELWKFEHEKEHSVENNSHSDRVHIIVDLLREER